MAWLYLGFVALLVVPWAVVGLGLAARVLGARTVFVSCGIWAATTLLMYAFAPEHVWVAIVIGFGLGLFVSRILDIVARSWHEASDAQPF